MAANVNESKVFRLNNLLCYFSDNGVYLAVAFQTNLLIKDTKIFGTCESFVFSDVIQYIEWSPDSEYILCANLKKAIVQIYSIYNPQWKFKLTEGSAGLQSVTWSPDSKYILTLADFNIQISIWSLENRNVSYIQNLKTSAFDKLHFSPDGKRLAVIVTEDRDVVEIYKTDNWRISRKLICDRLRSIDGIRWSPNDELLCIWCSSPAEPKLTVYSTVWEKPVVAFSPPEVASPREITYSCGKELKGIENVEWTPSGQLLAVIGFNEVITLLNYITWKPMSQLYLDPVIRECNYLTKVYKECVDLEKTSNKHATSCDERILCEIHERPIYIKIGQKGGNANFSIAKVKLFEFSTCGQYLALTHELYPTTLWIWDIFMGYHHYLLLESPVTAIKWNPIHPRLLVFSECTTRVYEWTRERTRHFPMSVSSAVDARWHPAGEKVALCSYNKATIHEINTCRDE